MLGPGVHSILRNGAFLLGTAWFGTALRTGYIIILARALGPAGYGLISSTQASYMMFVIAVSAGMPAFLSRERAAGRARGDESVRLTLIVQATALSFSAAAFFLLGFATEADAVTRLVFILFAGTVVARGLAVCARHVFVAFETSQHQFWLISIFRTGEVLSAAGALALGGGVVAIAVIHLVSWVLQAVAGLVLVHRRLAALRLRWPNFARLRAVAVGVLGISIALAAGDWLRLAPLAAVRYVAEDAPDVGQFALAWNAAVILSLMLVTAMNAAFPVISRARARADGKDAVYVDFCIRYGVLFGAAVLVAGMSFGPRVIVAVAGAKYASAGAIFAVALTLLSPIIIGYALDQTLLLWKRTRLVLSLNGGALAAVVAGFVPAFRTFGPIGAVLVVFAVLAVLVFVKVIVARRVAGMFLLPSLLRAAVSAGGALAAEALLSSLSPWVGLAGGLAVLGLMAFASRAITDRERDAFLRIVRTRNL